MTSSCFDCFYITGLAGVLVSTNRILTKALLKDERINTIIFFGVSIAILLACFVIFHVTRRSHFVTFYVTLCRGGSDVSSRNVPCDESARQRVTSHRSVAEDVSLVSNRLRCLIFIIIFFFFIQEPKL